MPIAYVFALMKKIRILKEIGERGMSKKEKLLRILDCLLFFLFGPFFLFSGAIIDILRYPIILFKNKKILKNKIHVKQDIDNSIISLLITILIQYMRHKRELVPQKEVVLAL